MPSVWLCIAIADIVGGTVALMYGLVAGREADQGCSAMTDHNCGGNLEEIYFTIWDCPSLSG